MRPTSGGDDLTTQWVKNATVEAIVLTLSSGSVELSDASFVRTATDGGYVADVWTSSASDVTILRSSVGGNAKLSYSYYTTWYNFSVPVRKGEGVKKLKLQIYAPDGLTHLGVGITTSSPYSSDGQNAGNFILRGSSALYEEENTVSGGSLTANGLQGVVESCSYDATSKIYTLTYDFGSMQKDTAGCTFSDYSITSLIFYLNCPCGGDTAKAHIFDGTRSLYFLSIDLLSD
jgi:hypothetical protein